MTVDNVSIYSAHNYTGSAQKSGTATLNSRLVEHQYTGVGTQTGSNFNGIWGGSTLNTTAKDYEGDPCGGAVVSLTLFDNQITGTARNSWGQVYAITGTVGTNGYVTAGIAVGGVSMVSFTGTLVGNKGNGTWFDNWGCRGTWSVTKQ